LLGGFLLIIFIKYVLSALTQLKVNVIFRSVPDFSGSIFYVLRV